MNERASYFLNELGCKLFNDVLKKHENKADGKLHVVDGGILEQLGDTYKNYATTVKTCDCSFYFNREMICKHIVAVRKHQLLPIFSLEVFHRRWWRLEITAGSSNGRSRLNTAGESSL